jgi:uncharacterized protein (DUF983 family)
MISPDSRTEPSVVYATLLGRCPRCGRGDLFAGFLKIAAACKVCALDYSRFEAGDGPAVFVILGLGAIIMMLVFWVEFRYEPPWWVHVVIWGPLTVGLAVWLLRVMKALLIAQQYTHRSTELEK